LDDDGRAELPRDLDHLRDLLSRMWSHDHARLLGVTRVVRACGSGIFVVARLVYDVVQLRT
jgi:hypothetical protein